MSSGAMSRPIAFLIGIALLSGACGGDGARDATTAAVPTSMAATTVTSAASNHTAASTTTTAAVRSTTTAGAEISEPLAQDAVIPVIWDDDGSPDGVIALMYLLAHPGIDVVALTVSVGEAHPSVFAPLLTQMLGLVGKDIPVAAGRETPLLGDNQFPEAWRIHTNHFWDIDLPAPVRSIESVSAGQLIVDTVNAAPKPVTLFVSGSLTNLAEALRLDPLIGDKVQRVVIMGGALDVEGNLDEGYPELGNTSAEWNVWIDPLAAEEVLSAGIPVQLIPLDATNQVTWSRQQVAAWESASSAQGALAATLHRWALGAMGQDELFIWDLIAAVGIDRPDLCVSEETHLQVVTATGPTEGRILADASQPANAVVCLDPDPAGIREHVDLVFRGAAAEELGALESGEATEEAPDSILIAGTWQGVIDSLDSDFSDDLTLVLWGDCPIGGICGTFRLAGADCRGDLQLLDAAHPTYSFLEILRSGGAYCIDGGVETLTFADPSTLMYHFEYQTEHEHTESVGTLAFAG